MLTASYSMLRDGVPYQALEADFYERCDTYKTLARLIRRIEQLGHVKVRPEAIADTPCTA